MKSDNNNFYIKEYAKAFGYNHLKYQVGKTVYVKTLPKGFSIFSIEHGDKYVNFFFNEQEKIFKVGDLALALLENTPLTSWEQTNDNV